MNVLEIRDITRKDTHIHYRQEYTGLAVFDSRHSTSNESRIEFSLEKTPLGEVNVKVRFLSAPDYPLIPVLRNLKAFILNLEKKGQLN